MTVGREKNMIEDRANLEREREEKELRTRCRSDLGRMGNSADKVQGASRDSHQEKSWKRPFSSFRRPLRSGEPSRPLIVKLEEQEETKSRAGEKFSENKKDPNESKGLMPKPPQIPASFENARQHIRSQQRLSEKNLQSLSVVDKELLKLDLRATVQPPQRTLSPLPRGNSDGELILTDWQTLDSACLAVGLTCRPEQEQEQEPKQELVAVERGGEIKGRQKEEQDAEDVTEGPEPSHAGGLWSPVHEPEEEGEEDPGMILLAERFRDTKSRYEEWFGPCGETIFQVERPGNDRINVPYFELETLLNLSSVLREGAKPKTTGKLKQRQKVKGKGSRPPQRKRGEAKGIRKGTTRPTSARPNNNSNNNGNRCDMKKKNPREKLSKKIVRPKSASVRKPSRPLGCVASNNRPMSVRQRKLVLEIGREETDSRQHHMSCRPWDLDLKEL